MHAARSLVFRSRYINNCHVCDQMLCFQIQVHENRECLRPDYWFRACKAQYWNQSKHLNMNIDRAIMQTQPTLCHNCSFDSFGLVQGRTHLANRTHESTNLSKKGRSGINSNMNVSIKVNVNLIIIPAEVPSPSNLLATNLAKRAFHKLATPRPQRKQTMTLVFGVQGCGV